MPRRLVRTVRQGTFEVRIDSDFEGVIAGCAASRPGRRTTWINPKIHSLYRELYSTGYCHTVETWAGGRLVGGLYGVALNGAFFGESMFSYERDASKVALVYLCARLVAGGFTLLDTQFVTDHLKQFGAIEIGRAQFHVLLERALAQRGGFLRHAGGRGGGGGAGGVGGGNGPPATADPRRSVGFVQRRGVRFQRARIGACSVAGRQIASTLQSWALGGQHDEVGEPRARAGVWPWQQRLRRSLGGCATAPNTSASLAPPKNYRQQVVAKVRQSEVQRLELLYVGITQPKQMWTGIQNGGTRPAVCVQVERPNIFGIRAAWFYLFYFENGKVEGYKLQTPSPPASPRSRIRMPVRRLTRGPDGHASIRRAEDAALSLQPLI